MWKKILELSRWRIKTRHSNLKQESDIKTYMIFEIPKAAIEGSSRIEDRAVLLRRNVKEEGACWRLLREAKRAKKRDRFYGSKFGVPATFWTFAVALCRCNQHVHFADAKCSSCACRAFKENPPDGVKLKSAKGKGVTGCCLKGGFFTAKACC